MTYSSFWTVDEARRVGDALLRELRQTARGGPFTVLDDLRDFGVQIPEVVRISEEYAAMCQDFPIIRNAMIIPSALV